VGLDTLGASVRLVSRVYSAVEEVSLFARIRYSFEIISIVAFFAFNGGTAVIGNDQFTVLDVRFKAF
jgi:hypothetical protein